MKKNLLILIFTFFGMSLIAQNHSSFAGEIVFASRNQQTTFWLFLNDVLQNENSVNSIKITDLPNMELKVRIVINNPEHSELNQTLRIDPNPSRNLYFVRMADHRFLIENARGIKGIQYTQKWNPGKKPIAPLQVKPQRAPQNNPHSDHSHHGNGHCPNSGTPAPGGCHNAGHGGCQGHHSNPPAQIAMNPHDFQMLLSRVNGQSFEKDKLEVAKMAISNNKMTTIQIVAVCKCFGFETTKLEFAKYAYANCFDKNNYFQVEEVFSFSSSKAELRDYISR